MRNSKLSIKPFIIPSIPLAVLSVSACFLLWIFPTIYLQLTSIEANYFSLLKGNIFINPLFLNLVNFAISLLNAFLLVQLNNKFTLIKTRTFLPVLLFLMLLGAWSTTHLNTSVHISLSLFIFSLFFLFNMYRDKKAVEQSFNNGLCIGIISIIFNPYLFFIPLIWMAFISLQCFTVRTFLASIFGVLCCWLVYVSASFFLNPDFSIYSIISITPSFNLDFNNLSLQFIVYFSLMVLILVVSIIGMYSNFHFDAIHTRTKLNFFVLILISVSILSLFFLDSINYFLPILALIYAFLASHAFTLKQNLFYTILFIIFCGANLAYAITSLITF